MDSLYISTGERTLTFVPSESDREMLLEMIACVEACVCYEGVE